MQNTQIYSKQLRIFSFNSSYLKDELGMNTSNKISFLSTNIFLIYFIYSLAETRDLRYMLHNDFDNLLILDSIFLYNYLHKPHFFNHVSSG